jgi:hypothetical protein
VFGARMEVEFVNDGPVTIVLDAWAVARRDGAILRSPHFTGLAKWALEAPIFVESWK